MIETKFKTIGGHDWSVTQFTGTKSIRVYHALMAALGTPVGQAIDGIASVKASTGKTTIAGVGVAKIMQQMILNNPDADGVEKLLFLLLSSSAVDKQPMSKAVFDTTFSGPDIVHLPAVITFVFEVNYGDFLTALKSYIAQFADAGETEKGDENPAD